MLRVRCAVRGGGRLLAGIVISSLLGACGTGDKGGDAGLTGGQSFAYSLFDPTGASNTATPGSPIIPFPFDALFSGATTPTLNIPLPDPANLANPANSLVLAANLQDGYSTTASLFTDFAGFVDLATVPAGLLFIDTSTGQPLAYGTDFTIQTSTAIGSDGVPINLERTRVLIEPLKPLKPATTYLLALTPAIRSRSGLPIVASDYFVATRSGTPVASQDTPFTRTLTPTQVATLEALRSGLIRPLVQALEAPVANGGAGLAEEQIVLAWSFTTQSIDVTLRDVAANATPGFARVVDTGQSTAAVGGFGLAEIEAGVIAVPYYLNDAGSPADPHSLAPLGGYWKADPAQPAASTFAPTRLSASPVPCAAFTPAAGLGLSPSASTTGCFPKLDASTAQTEVIPLLVTVPTAASGHTKPGSGWPVVIFQHGITRNRGDLLAVADSLAQAGFAAVAIDLPLHGVSPPDPLNPQPTDLLYRNALFAGTPAAALQTGERTFDLDLQNNATGASGPDGLADGSGTWFINLASLATSRDNLRQSVADLLQLKQTLALIDVDGDTTPDFDTTQVRYFGHSLGAIVATVFLGVDGGSGAGVLANPGGGIAKLLDGSASFGPRIAAGLAAQAGLTEGSDNYETFLRFAQTLVDSGDPANYAAAARASHPLYMAEVLGDAVVPNAVTSNCSTASGALVCTPAADADRVLLSGFLSGTDPLARLMGLAEVGPLTVPISPQPPLTGANLGVIARFTQGNHGSVLDPSGSAVNAGVTCELQRQAASFLATNGTALPVGGTCP